MFFLFNSQFELSIFDCISDKSLVNNISSHLFCVAGKNCGTNNEFLKIFKKVYQKFENLLKIKYG